MNIVIVVLIILFSLLFIYNAFLKNKSFIENLENATSSNTSNTGSCDASTLMYKNAGSVQALQDNVAQLMKQVNTLILNDDKQQTDIKNLQTLEKKYDIVAQKADQLANANKQRLLSMVNKAKGQSSAIIAKSKSLPSP